jgi:hypothetical protein
MGNAAKNYRRAKIRQEQKKQIRQMLHLQRIRLQELARMEREIMAPDKSSRSGTAPRLRDVANHNDVPMQSRMRTARPALTGEKG